MERALPGLRRRARCQHHAEDGRSDEYACSLCAAGYEPTLDEMVEVTFTVSPRVRRIAAHDPDELPPSNIFAAALFGAGLDLPDDFEPLWEEITLESLDLPAGEKAIMSLQLPPSSSSSSIRSPTPRSFST